VNVRDILTLYDYNYWATRRILTAGGHVSLEQFWFQPLIASAVCAAHWCTPWMLNADGACYVSTGPLHPSGRWRKMLSRPSTYWNSAGMRKSAPCGITSPASPTTIWPIMCATRLTRATSGNGCSGIACCMLLTTGRSTGARLLRS
jgi:hypothetical protein